MSKKSPKQRGRVKMKKILLACFLLAAWSPSFAVITSITGSEAPGQFITKINEMITDINASGGSPEGTAVLSTGEVSGSKFLREDGDGTSSWQTLAGGGDALVASPLSQFAATTSLQILGVISNETGAGALVFADTPTLIAPNLGTPSSVILTNASGTAPALTCGAVTTNANLTGHITSTGNATILGSFTVAQLNSAISDGAIPTSANYVDLVSAQSVAGVKTFGSFPVTPTAAPTTDYQVANKKYVDDNAGGAPEGTAVLSTGETGGAKFLREDGDGTSSWQAIAGGGDALVASPLSQFAATTSLQILGVISDETGYGALVFANGPTLIAPALGIPASGIMTNATGTAAGLTCGNVTTNANLTGHITSVGNASVLGSFTLAQFNAAVSDGSIPTNSDYVDLTTAQSVAGVKTFSAFPITPSAAPTTNYQVANKKYVDDNAGGAPEGTAVLSTGETGGSKFLREDGDGTSSWQAIGGGGDALTASPLSQFAATTSAQLAGVISDETGSGALVYATSPTLVTPALGTPASVNLANATGTAPSLTAGNVTTNASLTGHIVSTGNAATLGSFTAAQLSAALSDSTYGGDNSGDEAAASLAVAGVIEVATVAETNTGTDATRSVSPDGLDGWTGSAQLTSSGIEYREPVAIGDETTALTTGTKLTWYSPDYAITITDIELSVVTAPTDSGMIVDLHDDGVTIMGTDKLDIDVGEFKTADAVTQPAISDGSIAAGSKFEAIIDQIGSTVAGAGPKLYIYYTVD